MCKFIHLYVSGSGLLTRFYFITYYCPKIHMKIPTEHFQSLASRFAGRISAAMLLALIAATPAVADVVYVSSEIQGCTATSVCGAVQSDGTYTEVSITLGVTSVKGTATDRPPTPTASRAYLSGTTLTSTSAGVDIQPINPPLAVPGGIYKVEYNWNATSGNSSTNVVLSVSTADGVLSSNSTPVFQRSFANDATKAATWLFICYITNNSGVVSPKLSFRYQSGRVNAGDAGGNRLLFDCWRFTLVQPCLNVAVPGVTGPLSTNVTAVNVAGVSATATQVKIYQDAGTGMTNVGSLTVSSPPGTVQVPVTGTLVYGAKVSATQIVGSQESCVQASGILVGGGNQPLRVALSIRYDPTQTGPAGAAGTTAGNVYFLGSSTLLSGSPGQGAVLTPSTCWQTITFTRGDTNNPTDPSVIWAGTGPAVLGGRFGALDGLAIASQGDPGPYDIYFDHLENGTNGVVQSWEAGGLGQAGYGFSQPSFSGTTSGNMLTAPNQSAVSTNGIAYDGTKSCRVQWQFTDGLSNRWIRLVTAGATPVQNPELDLDQPITLKVLMLPAGSPLPHTFNGTVSSITNSVLYTSTDVTLGVTTTGGPFAYQWSFNGNPVTDATNQTLTISGFNSGNNGLYRLDVNDGTCTDVRVATLTAQDPIVTITNQPIGSIVNVGGIASFTVGADGHVPNNYPLNYQWQFNGTDIPGMTASSLTIQNAQISDAGGYSCNVYGAAFGTIVSSASATLDVVPADVAIGSGTGLRGNYFGSRFPTNGFVGAPTLSRVDPTVDFSFGTGSPDPSVSSDFFMVRWSGQVQALGDDTYTFNTISDDGVRLWVNSQKLIDNWTGHAPTTNSGSIALVGTNKYDLLLEYFENTGGATAKLYWTNSAGGIAWGPVLQSQLYPGAANTAPSETITTTVSGADLTVRFGPGTCNLQAATSVTGPYTTIATNIVSPYTIVNAFGSGPLKFYRLQIQ
jgi:hypothetical protein